MADLLLGPVLRHVGSTDATVWVETSSPCTVEILGHSERTWTVAGHHYALVVIDSLEPGSTTRYGVRLDGIGAWPHPGCDTSVIRTLNPEAHFDLAFGSCRVATTGHDGTGAEGTTAPNDSLGADALVVYAQRMRSRSHDRWPGALVLLGDQVYADELSPEMLRRVGARHDLAQPPGPQVHDFEEYTWLYSQAWSEPDVRWLLSTVPTSMVFDDHDVHDDWNTSRSWRADVETSDWWEERIVGALMSYWIYQHLGNLSPAQLAQNAMYAEVRGYDGDAEPILRTFASEADEEADGAHGVQWSYRRDFGSVRLLVIDSRCGRVLTSDRREMVSDPEFTWTEEQTIGDYDHLLVGTSLPWLLPRALHDLEAWDEQLAFGVRGRRVARWAENLRRAADLEHWAAFHTSFDRLVRLFDSVGRGLRTGTSRRAPATICVLSGDVHHAYAARARFAGPVESRIYQLTCSPLHNRVPVAVRAGFRASWSRVAERSVRALLRLVTPVPSAPVEWERIAGPSFGNQIATLRLHGRAARLSIERARRHRDGSSYFETVTDLVLSSPEEGSAEVAPAHPPGRRAEA